jgi:hypothetical protein
MKPSETKPTKEEILEKHTKDSQWYPPVCDTRVLKAMQEYADLYHKAETEKLLPSDEEMYEEAKDNYRPDDTAYCIDIFRYGAKWFRDKIKDQLK